MKALTIVCLGLGLGVWACDDGAEPGGAGGAGGGDMRVPIGTVCDVEALAAQCPPGSLPIVDEALVEACDGALEVTDDSGAVTGVCRAQASCQFICNFSDPCRCGVDRVTADGVFCAECVTACGDARCEGAERPETCPIDCAERCPPDAERCNGNDREVCEDTGIWTRLTCRSDQRCITAVDPQTAGLSLCDTVVSQGGGVFHGLGAWHPVQVDDYDAVRFASGTLTFDPLVFLDDGRLLGLRDRRFVLGAPGEEPALLPGDAPSGVAAEYAVHGTRGQASQAFAVAQTRVAGGSVLSGQVRDVMTGGLRFLADFGGLPSTLNGLVDVTPGPWAISPDASAVAHAVSVPFGDEPRVTIIVWDAGTGDVRRLLRFRELDTGVPADALPAGLVFNADGSNLIAAYPKPDGSLLVVWDVEARRFARVFASGVSPGRGDGRLIGSRAGDDRLIWTSENHTDVWDLRAERLLLSQAHGPASVVFTPDGQSIIIGETQRRIDDATIDRMLPRAGRVLFDPQTPRVLIDTVIYGTGE